MKRSGSRIETDGVRETVRAMSVRRTGGDRSCAVNKEGPDERGVLENRHAVRCLRHRDVARGDERIVNLKGEMVACVFVFRGARVAVMPAGVRIRFAETKVEGSVEAA